MKTRIASRALRLSTQDSSLSTSVGSSDETTFFHSFNRRGGGFDSDGRGAAAGENHADRIFKCLTPLRRFRLASRASSKVFASSGTRREKISLIEYQYADRAIDRLPALAAELVRLNVNLIVRHGRSHSNPICKEATSTIPIVMAQDPDPVGTGFVASLARPGGNVTGLSQSSPRAKRKTAGPSEGTRS